MQKFIVLFVLVAGIFVLWFSAPEKSTAAPSNQNFSPPMWILGPIQGADGGDAVVNTNLDKLQQNNIPISAFHFDAPDWQLSDPNASVCAWQFGLSDALLQRLKDSHIRALFWITPLVNMDKCPTDYANALANGYLVKDGSNQVITTSANYFGGHGSWIDFSNPAAKDYWHARLDALLNKTSDVTAGFYTDNVRPDLNNDSTYSEAYSADLLAYTRAHIADGDVVMKRFGNNTPSDNWLHDNAHVAYMNDLPTDFSGMKKGIRRIFNSSSLVPLPFNEFSGYAAVLPDQDVRSETYIRRMHYGAFQPVMENVPKGNANPWNQAVYPAGIMAYFKDYTTLHWELLPYLHSYDVDAFEHNTQILRNFNSTNFTTQLGNEIFVQYVTQQITTKPMKMQVFLPAGTWINYWNENQVFTGPKTLSYEVPLGHEPIFIRSGALVPMQVRDSTTGHGTTSSDGALTINVYPSGNTTFGYYDPVNHWITLRSNQKSNRLALCTQGSFPSQSALIYRIRWPSAPTRVGLQDGAVGVNVSWGTALSSKVSEVKAEKASSGWYYDSFQHRLIVKVSNPGTGCPTP